MTKKPFTYSLRHPSRQAIAASLFFLTLAIAVALRAVQQTQAKVPVRSGVSADSGYAVSGGNVGQWELFEIDLTASGAYGNPFTGVEVYADFVSPSNQPIRVYGFYDGNGSGAQGQSWKIRFMSGQTGLWTWKTISSNPSDAGLHNQQGSFTVINSNIPGPVKPNPWIPGAWKHANNENYLWTLGYSIHMLGADRTHPGVGGWEDYLDWLETNRFNGVMMLLQVPSFQSCSTCQVGMAPWSALGGNPPPTYAYNNNGEVDYFLMPWAKAGSPNEMATSDADADFTRMYLPFWERLDEVLQEMQARGMIAHTFQYDDQTFWPPAGSPQEQVYWDYIIRRLGGHWNVTYNDGIDLFEYRAASWVNEWQQYFQSNDPFMHARSSRHGNDNPVSAMWRSVQAADENDPQSIAEWRSLMALLPIKPVTEDDGIRAGRGIPDSRFQQLAWWSVQSGAGGFGATWAGVYEPGNWFSNLANDSGGVERVKIRNEFIFDFDLANQKVIPFWLLAVRDDLTTGNKIYTSAAPGLHYLVYFDNGANSSTNIDLTDTSTSLPITWLDPETGQQVPGGMSTPGAVQTLNNPFGGPAVVYIGNGETNLFVPPPFNPAITLPVVRTSGQ